MQLGCIRTKVCKGVIVLIGDSFTQNVRFGGISSFIFHIFIFWYKLISGFLLSNFLIKGGKTFSRSIL